MLGVARTQLVGQVGVQQFYKVICPIVILNGYAPCSHLGLHIPALMLHTGCYGPDNSTPLQALPIATALSWP